LKVVATILSIGILAPFIWKKPDGRKLSDNVKLTLMGANSRSEKFAIDETHDIKPSAMDEKIPIVRNNNR
jgi:hypothetical protein